VSDQAHVLEGGALEKALAQLRVEGGPSGRPERSCGRVSSRTRLFADELLFAELAADDCRHEHEGWNENDFCVRSFLVGSALATLSLLGRSRTRKIRTSGDRLGHRPTNNRWI
jgi:hypothetical protein